jgi:hypothetical protein
MLLEDRPPAGCSSEALARSGHGPWKSRVRHAHRSSRHFRYAGRAAKAAACWWVRRAVRAPTSVSAPASVGA